MANAVATFRYLNPEEVKELGEDWQCYVCHEGGNKENISSHCGTLHAAHAKCELAWIKVHKKCGFCHKEVNGDEIKKPNEIKAELYYEEAPAPRSWGPIITSTLTNTVYPAASACAQVAGKWLLKGSIYLLYTIEEACYSARQKLMAQDPDQRPFPRDFIPLPPPSREGPIHITINGRLSDYFRDVD